MLFPRGIGKGQSHTRQKKGAVGNHGDMENYYRFIGIAIKQCLDLKKIGRLFGDETGVVFASKVLTAAVSSTVGWSRNSIAI